MTIHQPSSHIQLHHGAIVFAAAFIFYLWINSSHSPGIIWGEIGHNIEHPIPSRGQTKISIFTAVPPTLEKYSSKEIRNLKSMASSDAHSPWESIPVTLLMQKEFIVKSGHQCHENTISAYNRFISSGMVDMALELWKYCQMFTDLKDKPTTAYIDFESPLLATFDQLFDSKENYAVVGDDRYFSTNMIHGSLFIIQSDQIDIIKSMIAYIVEKDPEALRTDPFFLSRTLFNAIHDPAVISKWKLLSHRCHIDLRKKADTTFIGDNEPTYFQCPIWHKFCCEIQASVARGKHSSLRAVMMTTHFVLPRPLLPNVEISPKPYALDRDGIQVVPTRELKDETPFIVTLREDKSVKKGGGVNMNESFHSAYDVLQEKKCLTSFKLCKKCLKTTNSCPPCRKFCGCFCDICSVDIPKKAQGTTIKISLPMNKRDPNRIIPRIIHQTWFEGIGKESHPNKSRMVETWKKSGWEYKFYDDEDVKAFLSLHFPPEIAEAFNAIIPGAFKADIFRYCVLFIFGGVYSDVDTILESSLDSAILSDTGFMIGLDSPGSNSDHRHCLWNGFVAAAPGHPFLAQVIETVVNNIRNRFTSADIINSMCPGPLSFDTLLSYDLLFTTGPCILGASVNRVLGLPPQSPFEHGTLIVPSKSTEITGKTIILHQNKKDMGAHRFTWLERNLIILSTDHPNSNDISDTTRPHYSKTKKDVAVFGEEKLYIDRKAANEEINFTF